MRAYFNGFILRNLLSQLAHYLEFQRQVVPNGRLGESIAILGCSPSFFTVLFRVYTGTDERQHREGNR